MLPFAHKSFYFKSVGGKNQEMKMQRDLFGRLLGVSTDYKIDVLRILSYPITLAHLSLCHLDREFYKSVKSVLSKCLEANIDHDNTDIYEKRSTTNCRFTVWLKITLKITP